jgi:uncharacterized protein YbjT (DUF2867 family)
VKNHAGTTVLVAGATGYLGGYVCRALSEAGYRVKALTRDRGRLEPVLPYVDEVFVGQATDDATLNSLCQNVDVVFSSIGIHGSISRKITVWDVDYGANMNILRRAQASGVRQFIFISVLNAEVMRKTIQVAEARERVGDAVRTSGMTWTLLRPTGFFNDLEGFFNMINGKGRAWLIGKGNAMSNPIHGADLAEIVVQTIGDPHWHNAAFGVGGPDICSMREIAEMVFESIGKPVKISTLPPGLMGLLASIIQPFHTPGADFLRFFTYEMINDGIGEPHGTHHMSEFFAALAKRARESEQTA